MNKQAQEIISKLSLTPHPEGGYFKEVYRNNEVLTNSALPERYDGDHCYATSIYFLLHDDITSKFHKLKSDETWHHYTGSAVKIYSIDPSGELRIFLLGKDLNKSEFPQVTIQHSNWFGAELIDENSYSLIGCTVYPGFEFTDFEIGKKDYLIETYPQHSEIIKRLS